MPAHPVHLPGNTFGLRPAANASYSDHRVEREGADATHATLYAKAAESVWIVLVGTFVDQNLHGNFRAA
jgi:hypothetical protein